MDTQRNSICAKPRESLAFQVTVNENFGLGKAQGTADAASKEAQDAAKAASVAATAATNAAAAATSAADTATQRLSEITGPVLDKLADLLSNSKSTQIKLSAAADQGVRDIAGALQWKEVGGTTPFRTECEYRLHAKSWLFELGNKTGATEFDVIATKISTENITAVFLGGPIDPTHIPLAVKKDTKTIATEIGGPGSGATRSVVVLERCPPTIR
jgi:hypothetical protein